MKINFFPSWEILKSLDLKKKQNQQKALPYFTKEISTILTWKALIWGLETQEVSRLCDKGSWIKSCQWKTAV